MLLSTSGYNYRGFQDRCLQPLGHPSKPYLLSTCGDSRNLTAGLSAHLMPAFLKTGIRAANACDERGVRAESLWRT